MRSCEPCLLCPVSDRPKDFEALTGELAGANGTARAVGLGCERSICGDRRDADQRIDALRVFAAESAQKVTRGRNGGFPGDAQSSRLRAAAGDVPAGELDVEESVHTTKDTPPFAAGRT